MDDMHGLGSIAGRFLWNSVFAALRYGDHASVRCLSRAFRNNLYLFVQNIVSPFYRRVFTVRDNRHGAEYHILTAIGSFEFDDGMSLQTIFSGVRFAFKYSPHY